MAHPNRKEPTEMEQKAKIIGYKLKELRKKCANDAEKKSIPIDEVVCIMEFMAPILSTDHAYLFQDHFIGHLDVYVELSRLDENRTDQFTTSLGKITEMLCGVIASMRLPVKHRCRLLSKWLECLDHIASELKYHIFRQMDLALRQNCGRFLIEANCFSMQMKMLSIICSYLHDEQPNKDDSIKRPHMFLKIFSGAIDNVNNGVLIDAAMKLFHAKLPLAIINKKHRILNLLNGLTKNRSVHSLPIDSLKLKPTDKPMQEYNSGWMHLNTVSGTVEFSVSANSKSKSMCITPRLLQNIEINESFEIQVKFTLLSKSQHNSEQNEDNKPSKCIEIIMAPGCDKSELTTLLGQVFPAIDIETTQNDMNNNSNVDLNKNDDVKTSNSSKGLKRSKRSSSFSYFGQEPTIEIVNSAQMKLPIRRISILPKDSSLYGDDNDDVDDGGIVDLDDVDHDIAVVHPIAIQDVSLSKRDGNDAVDLDAIYDIDDIERDAVVQKLSKGSASSPASSKIETIQNNLISSTRKRLATRQNTKRSEKSSDADKLSLYDFVDDDTDDQPVAKKGRGRGRGRRPAQPKKRAKPAAFPRVKSPSVERSPKKYTIRARTPVGELAKKSTVTAKLDDKQQVDRMAIDSLNGKADRMKRAMRERTSNYATTISSGLDKLGAVIKTNLFGRQKSPGKKESPKKADHTLNGTEKMDADTTANGHLNGDRAMYDGKAPEIDLTDIDDMGVDMVTENPDANGNENANANDDQCQCQCRNGKLKVKLIKIRDSANRAINIMDTCCCDDDNA